MFLLFVGLNVFSQQIINNDFEEWYEKFYYNEPEGGYYTSNLMAYVNAGMGNVIKTTDAVNGSYALRLETIISPSGPIQGMAFIGQPGNNGISGGMPYTDKPDSLVAFIKYNIQPNDTALIGVLLKNNGQVVGVVSQKITGVQTQYIRFSAPFTYMSPLNPDSIIVVFMSSLPGGTPVQGSYIVIDNVQLINANAQLPNNSFENWFEIKTEEAIGWESLNFLCKTIPSVTKTTDSYSGQYAMKIENVELMMGDTAGIITNGYFTYNNQFIGGGLKINANPKKLSFYYKYFPETQNDFGLVAVSLFNQGIIDTTIFGILTASYEYTYYEILFHDSISNYDTLNITLLAGMYGEQSSSLGNILIVDNFNIEYYSSSSTNELSKAVQNIIAYPNPFDSEISIFINNDFSNKFYVYVYDYTGKKVYEKFQTDNLIKITNKEVYVAGLYKVVIISKNNLYKATIIKK
ncbi:MAG: T9SS type A sorting domain-containing protein [Bacteroidales bacterium]|nr:T9SS type A sorting domain-containing protein [Bacteroidales bacterium]